MENKIYEGKSMEEVKLLACEEFGLKESELEFIVLNEKKGFLGMGAKLQVEVRKASQGITKAKEYIQMILDTYEIQGYIEKRVRGEQIEFAIEAGEDNKYLIGRGARNLMALQVLVSSVVNKDACEGEERSVLVDVGGYKRKRERHIENMAVQIAKQVLRTKQKVKLDYLNAYERKLVHSKLSTWQNIKTHSEGEEPSRYLIIEYKD